MKYNQFKSQVAYSGQVRNTNGILSAQLMRYMRKTYKYKIIRLIGVTKTFLCVSLFETCGTVRNMYMNLQLQDFVKR